MTISFSKLKTISLLILAVLLNACDGHDQNLLQSDTIPSIVKVAFSKNSAEEKLLISLPSTHTDGGFCLVKAGEKCLPGTSNFTNLTPFRKTNDRHIYNIPYNTQVHANKILEIFSGTQSLRKFRISPDSQIQPQISDLSSAVQSIHQTAMKEELAYLTRDEWMGRLAGTAENDAAADWLVNHLQKLNILPLFNGSYKQAFAIPLLPGSPRSHNIAGIIPGTDPELKNEYILIGAHMDHTGSLTKGYTCGNGNSTNNICNGADDNGSGTVTVLNIAKALTQIKSQLKRSVIVMWFSGEEEGLIGSKFFVDNSPVPLQNINLMINLDMVGYLRQNQNRLFAIGTTATRPEYKIAEQIVNKYNGITLHSSPSAQGGSDHAPFMAKGIPAIFFHTGVSSNINYHKTSDTADKIDYVGMENIGRIALETLFTAANHQKESGFGLVSTFGIPLLPPEELEKNCHHLIDIEDKILHSIDFSDSNYISPSP